MTSALQQVFGGLDAVCVTFDRPRLQPSGADYALLKASQISPMPSQQPSQAALRPVAPCWRLCDRRSSPRTSNSLEQVPGRTSIATILALRRLVEGLVGRAPSRQRSANPPQEAFEVGVVDEVAPVDQVIERAMEWCKARLTLPAEAMTVTRREARADLVAVFEPNIDPELQKVTAASWHPAPEHIAGACGEAGEEEVALTLQIESDCIERLSEKLLGEPHDAIDRVRTGRCREAASHCQ